MVISYVLRVRPDALTEGCFVGEIEAVASQERARFRSVDQMKAFVLTTMDDQVCSGSTARQRAVVGDDESRLDRGPGR